MLLLGGACLSLGPPAASLPNQGRRGPGGTRTRTLELDRLMCSRYTTGPDERLSRSSQRAQAQTNNLISSVSFWDFASARTFLPSVLLPLEELSFKRTR